MTAPREHSQDQCADANGECRQIPSLLRHQISSVVAQRSGSQEIVDSTEDGAPRPMKMGTTASPWRCDAGAGLALQSVILRRPAISHYPLHAAASPISQACLVYVQ
jgi:hypothetical protein